MNSLVSRKNGRPSVTSKEIADKFGKPHKNVIRDIANLKCSDEFRALNFEPSVYTSPQNKKFECFNMTKDGFVFLCMGFTGAKAAEYKEAYIHSYNKMESYLKNEMADNSLMDSINKLSGQLDDLAAAGSAWGQTGHEIRKKKKEATEELVMLMDKAQLQLGF